MTPITNKSNIIFTGKEEKSISYVKNQDEIDRLIGIFMDEMNVWFLRRIPFFFVSQSIVSIFCYLCKNNENITFFFSLKQGEMTDRCGGEA